MLLWFKDVMNVTEKLQNFTLLSISFIRSDLINVTRGTFIYSLVSCPFFRRGVNNLFRPEGISLPNLGMLLQKNNEPTLFILFRARTVITSISDRPNVSLVQD